LFNFFDVKQNGEVTPREFGRRFERLVRLMGASYEDAREIRKHAEEFL